MCFSVLYGRINWPAVGFWTHVNIYCHIVWTFNFCRYCLAWNLLRIFVNEIEYSNIVSKCIIIRQIIYIQFIVCMCVDLLEISQVWLETLLTVMELLPKEVISKEVSLFAIFVTWQTLSILITVDSSCYHFCLVQCNLLIDRQTDRRTDTWLLCRPCTACYAGSFSCTKKNPRRLDGMTSESISKVLVCFKKMPMFGKCGKKET